MPDARRQLGQYKRMIREEEQTLRWVWLYEKKVSELEKTAKL